MARRFPRWGWWAPCPGTLPWTGASTASRTHWTLSLTRGLGEEVAGYQTAYPVQLTHEKAVVVHLAVDVDLISRLEAQLHLLLGKRVKVKLYSKLNYCLYIYTITCSTNLSVNIWRQLLWIVIVQGDHLLHRHARVDVTPAIVGYLTSSASGTTCLT